jgi:2-hydroxychromene-2-carboxylate isomerase
MSRIDFWYDLASSYSYPAAMRIEAAAADAGVVPRWRPFLLGAIFKAQGWADSPFNLLPIKGRYMQRDLERTCAALGLPFSRPDPFPQSSLTAMRIVLIGHDDGWGAAFAKAVYRAEFAEGRNIGDRAVLTALLSPLVPEPEEIVARAEAPENKARLRTETEEAQRLGIFGAPSFVTEDRELFWGNDRLEQAIHWARRGASALPSC